MRLFFRIENLDTKQGLWFNSDGTYSGIFHDMTSLYSDKFLMSYDPEHIGWLSAFSSLDHLFRFITAHKIKRLQRKGFFIQVYFAIEVQEATEYRQHHLIRQSNSIHITKIVLSPQELEP